MNSRKRHASLRKPKRVSHKKKHTRSSRGKKLHRSHCKYSGQTQICSPPVQIGYYGHGPVYEQDCHYQN